MTTYPRITPRSQFNDPTTVQDGLNCTPTAFVMLLDLAAGLTMWPGQFRKLQGDNEGGISIPDGARAWDRATNARLDWSAPNDGAVPPVKHGDGIAAEQAWGIATSGRGLVWQGLYAVLERAGYSLQPGFVAGHALYVDGARAGSIRREAFICDPLGRQGYQGQWIPWNVLVDYGTALGRGSLIYAAWAAPMLPDTSEDTVTVVSPVPRETGHVSSSGLVDIWTADGDHHEKVKLTAVKADAVEYVITQSDNSAPKGGPFRRLAESPYAGYYVASAVVTWTPPDTAGDTKHTVLTTVHVDGVVVDSSEVQV